MAFVSPRNGGFDQCRIDVVGPWIDIHEYRFCAGPRNGTGGCKEGERRGDDLVSRTEAQAHQCVENRVRSAGHADGILTARERSHLFLKFGDLRTAYANLGFQNLAYRGEYFIFDGGVLRSLDRVMELSYSSRDFRSSSDTFTATPTERRSLRLLNERKFITGWIETGSRSFISLYHHRLSEPLFIETPDAKVLLVI